METAVPSLGEDIASAILAVMRSQKKVSEFEPEFLAELLAKHKPEYPKSGRADYQTGQWEMWRNIVNTLSHALSTDASRKFNKLAGYV